MKAKRQTNAMVRHNILYHLGRQVDYQMSVVSLHSDPISRLCTSLARATERCVADFNNQDSLAGEIIVAR